MRKGLNALEIVFGMLLLVIVTFVLIKLITNIVTEKKVTEPLQQFDQAYKFSQEVAKCKDLCSKYLTNDCNIRDAVDYCLTKVNIDINGNKKTGENYAGGLVANLPYCEDGLYCFHIDDCSCGTYRLNPENCRKILCQYYINNIGIDPSQAAKIITGPKGINFGTCDPNIEKWNIELPYENYNLKPYFWTDNAQYTTKGTPNIDPQQENFVCFEYSSSTNE
ncbi:MAG: hypothetical protein QW350_01620 [Candidatus Aenigmatarchaeota archaeon]|nr:hypothetical protein [Candidatus Aenigmarchaeota archaeon]